jgi:hypothetical protein
MDGLEFCARKMFSLIMLFDHLQIQPAVSSLFQGWWAASTTILRHLAIDIEHRVIDTTPPIGNRGWRSFWMSSALEDFENALTGLASVTVVQSEAES